MLNTFIASFEPSSDICSGKDIEEYLTTFPLTETFRGRFLSLLERGFGEFCALISLFYGIGLTAALLFSQSIETNSGFGELFKESPDMNYVVATFLVPVAYF